MKKERFTLIDEGTYWNIQDNLVDDIIFYDNAPSTKKEAEQCLRAILCAMYNTKDFLRDQSDIFNKSLQKI